MILYFIPGKDRFGNQTIPIYAKVQKCSKRTCFVFAFMAENQKEKNISFI